MKAVWKGAVLAQSHDTAVVEGNHYFPPASLATHYLRPTDERTHCWWKGDARYYDVIVGQAVNRAAAWQYPEPYDAARAIKGYVAFWRGVQLIPE